MSRGSIATIRGYINTLQNIVFLLWQAQPTLSVSILILQVLQGIVPLGHAWLFKSLLDLIAIGFQVRELPWQGLAWVLTIQFILTVVANLIQSLISYLYSELNRQIDLTVQLAIYRKLNGILGLEPFENPHIQNFIQMGMMGAQMGPIQVYNTSVQLVSSLVTIIGFIGVLIGFYPLLALLLLSATLPHLIVQLRMGHLRFQLVSENTPKQKAASYYSMLLATPFYAKELLLFGLGKHFLDKFHSLMYEINRSQQIQQKHELRSGALSSLFSIIISSTAFIIVVLLAFGKNLSLGDVSFYTSAVENVQMALSSIAFGLAGLNESVLFFSKYQELMAIPQPIAISPIPQPVNRLTSTIEFRGVSFRYGEGKPWVLRDVNLSLASNKSLALVGLNGSGKTTLVKLLTRMYDPLEGQILWDGVDIRQFDPNEFRQHIGTIFQDFVRYDLTAFENIALGDVRQLNVVDIKEIRSKVWNVARQVGVHEVIQSLPQGYETILSRWLGDDVQGIDLSGGEWQKIAIARMLMRDAELLILDEPTSALDAQSEYDLYNRFVQLINGRASLLISHRFSSVKMADHIAVLKDGRIIEYGSHSELITYKGEYARLYKIQSNLYQ